MLAFITGHTWTDAQITIDDGGGASTYTLVATDNNAYSAMTSLVAWATATFGPVFAWSWTPDTDTGGASVIISADGAFTLAANAAAQELMGWLAAYVSRPSHEADAAFAGSLDPDGKQIVVRGAYGVLDDEAPAAANGVTRAGVPGLSLQPIAISTILSPLETGRVQAVLSAASNPRQAWVYDEPAATWRRLSVGAVSMERVNGTLWAFTAETAGGLA